jgi:hypothetical protein
VNPVDAILVFIATIVPVYTSLALERLLAEGFGVAFVEAVPGMELGHITVNESVRRSKVTKTNRLFDHKFLVVFISSSSSSNILAELIQR